VEVEIKMRRIRSEGLDLKDRVVFINRVAKVVKGGKRFSFAAVVVVGDLQGHVGVGTGKASEVAESIRKAVENAKKNLIVVPIKNQTLPCEVIGCYSAERVFLKPAAPGTGIVAGAHVRAVMDLAGVANVLTKCLGSGNALNVVRATLAGLSQLKFEEEVTKERQAHLGVPQKPAEVAA